MLAHVLEDPCPCQALGWGDTYVLLVGASCLPRHMCWPACCRIHARAGPLVGEAAEGVSQVKCKVRGFTHMCKVGGLTHVCVRAGSVMGGKGEGKVRVVAYMHRTMQCHGHMRQIMQCHAHIHQTMQCQAHMHRTMQCHAHMHQIMQCHAHMRQTMQCHTHMHQIMQCHAHMHQTMQCHAHMHQTKQCHAHSLSDEPRAQPEGGSFEAAEGMVCAHMPAHMHTHTCTHTHVRPPTQIIAKACRELLRGSFSVTNEDAANLSDTLRRWVGGAGAARGARGGPASCSERLVLRGAGGGGACSLASRRMCFCSTLRHWVGGRSGCVRVGAFAACMAVLLLRAWWCFCSTLRHWVDGRF